MSRKMIKNIEAKTLTAKADANLSAISGLSTLLDLVPFMWVIAIIGVAVALGYKAFKD